ncbi:MAG: hypothetical protein ACRCSF_04200 [Mycobacteriaceae bacterium]
MATVTGVPPELDVELRLLAQAVIDRLEPIVHAAAKAPTQTDGTARDSPVGCSWCPVCALAALVSGEQHELLSVVATYGASLLVLVRAMLDGGSDLAAPSQSTATSKEGTEPGLRSDYQLIDVTIL